MRRSAVVVPALLAVLLVGACSSPVAGNPAASAPSAADTAEAAAPRTDTGDPSDTVSTPDAASPTAAGNAAGGAAPTAAGNAAGGAAGTAGTASFCAAARTDLAQEKSLVDALTGNTDLTRVVAQVRASNAAVEAAAPPAVSADVQAVFGLSDRELDLLASSHGDLSAFAQDPGFRQAAIGAAAAGTRLSAYLKSSCGLDAESILGLGGG